MGTRMIASLFEITIIITWTLTGSDSTDCMEQGVRIHSSGFQSGAYTLTQESNNQRSRHPAGIHEVQKILLAGSRLVMTTTCEEAGQTPSRYVLCVCVCVSWSESEEQEKQSKSLSVNESKLQTMHVLNICQNSAEPVYVAKQGTARAQTCVVQE
ncbi:hypothetical protein J3F83DRAFT_726403 [Trichoderma novae-zelandiae]